MKIAADIMTAKPESLNVEALAKRLLEEAGD